MIWIAYVGFFGLVAAQVKGPITIQSLLVEKKQDGNYKDIDNFSNNNKDGSKKDNNADFENNFIGTQNGIFGVLQRGYRGPQGGIFSQYKGGPLAGASEGIFGKINRAFEGHPDGIFGETQKGTFGTIRMELESFLKTQSQIFRNSMDTDSRNP